MKQERLFSLSIDGKDDFVIMTEGEAMLLKIKETGGTRGFEMYDMTERYGFTPDQWRKTNYWKEGLLRSCGLDKSYG
jgi:hypothetical protein